jgi:hypothetical protein
MAKFDLTRILLQDFGKKYEDIIGKLAPVINNSFEQIAAAFNNGLTIKENLAAQEIELPITAPINAQNPIFFKSTLRSQAKTLFVGNVVTISGTAPTGYPFFTWEVSNNQIKITNITNLTNGSKYIITVHTYS